MSGFCGHCGRPRSEGDRFCSGCGAELQALPRFCPTCGQPWPVEQGAHGTLMTTAVSAVVPPIPTEVPAPLVRGAYRSVFGPVYYDGASWFAASDLGGLWIPDVTRPFPAFETATAALELISAEQESASALPRGPLAGPEYDPTRDCGNCGFEITDRAAPCPHCGSASTGLVFTPGG